MIDSWFGRITMLLPQKIKHRLFLSFVLVILIPFFILQFYYYRQTEELLVQKISEQDRAQLAIMKSDLNEITSLVFKQLIRLEKENVVIEGLRALEEADWLEQSQLIRELLIQLSIQMPAQSMYLDYAVMDIQGRSVYMGTEENISGTEEWGQQALRELMTSSQSYSWTISESDTLSAGIESRSMLTLTGLLQDQGELLGVSRIRFDLSEWIGTTSRNLPVKSNFYLVGDKDTILARTEAFGGNKSSMITQLVQNDNKTINDNSHILYNGMSVGFQSYHLTLVSTFPLHLYFGDFKLLEHKFLLTFMTLTALFIVLTFLIATMITRPLSLLKRKMESMTHTDLKTLLPEKPYYGELLVLARAFNTMVSNMNQLFHRLKMEERQKEAVKFQMLLAQMNPHFLLNTLNTLKWNAISHDDQTTADICIHLGKLLETSLNAEVDLIYLLSEIELVEAYMQIQNFRYEQRFTIHYEYDEQLQYVLLPKLSLQPLIENAIVHGFAGMSHGNIIVRAYELEQRLIVEVIDNGQGIENANKCKPKRTRKSLGLSNVHERLQLLFKQDGDLQLIAMDKGTMVRMYLPKLVAAPYNIGGSTDVEAAHR